MDPQQTTPPPGLINDEQKQSLITELGLDSLPEDQKAALLNNIIDTALNRIFNRISSNFTEEDLKMLDTLQEAPNSDQAVNQYLLSKVPNMGNIADEEIALIKDEMKTAIEAMKTSLPQG